VAQSIAPLEISSSEPLTDSSRSNAKGCGDFRLAPAGIPQLKSLESASLTPVRKMIRPYHLYLLDNPVGMKGARFGHAPFISPRQVRAIS
jgi:hypothetical protein